MILQTKRQMMLMIAVDADVLMLWKPFSNQLIEFLVLFLVPIHHTKNTIPQHTGNFSLESTHKIDMTKGELTS